MAEKKDWKMKQKGKERMEWGEEGDRSVKGSRMESLGEVKHEFDERKSVLKT